MPTKNLFYDSILYIFDELDIKNFNKPFIAISNMINPNYITINKKQ